MNSKDVAYCRMANQQIAGASFTRSADLVQWMGCVQAQDYTAAKWAVGCRLANATHTSIEQDFNEDSILRTHILRPTWHFVCPADIRWMLKLSAPKIRALSRPYHRQLGIDEGILRQSKKVIAKALGKHHRLTREELALALREQKINVTDSRLGHLLMDAELDALICSAGRIGKKFAYQLLDDVVPAVTALSHEESLSELARRYFLSRGPASLHDFAWWAGLTLTAARKGQEMNRSHLQQVAVNGTAYWCSTASLPPPSPGRHTVRLLPTFDEYTVGYKVREDVLAPEFSSQCSYGLSPVIIHKGQVIGVWRRTETKEGMHIETKFFKATVQPSPHSLAAAIKKYTSFFDR
jgi:Winged helix DNA-binding domain